MPIPTEWTISGPASGSFDSLGAVSARMSFAYLAEDVLEIVFPDPGHVASDWTHDEEVTLLRNGSTFFKGRIDRKPRSGSLREDARRVRVVGPWTDLMSVVYAETWTHWNGSGTATSTAHPHAILGTTDSGGLYTDTREALEQVIGYAASIGVDISAGTLMTGKDVPLIECANRSCGDLIRQILRWHPKAQAWIDYATMTFNVSESASTVTIDASAQGVTWELIKRDDLVPSNVIVSYETTGFDSDALTSDDPENFKRVTIHADSAGGTTRGRKTLLVSVPVSLPGNSPKCHKQAILTRVLPRTGATNSEAKQWWIDHSPLKRLGVAVADVELPSSTADGAVQHTLYVWHDVTDENGDIITELIMPSATGIVRETGDEPEYFTDNINLLPRELVDGTLHDWMRRKQGMVTARCTVAVKKSVIESLAEPEKSEAMRGNPVKHTISSTDYYLYDWTVTVRATNAITKVYTHWVGNEADGEPTASEQIIPGLASAIYTDRSAAQWEGEINTVAALAGATRYLPARVNLSNSGVAAHSTMAARTRSEVIDLKSNVTSLSLGIAGHLEPGDFAQLIKISRDCQRDTYQVSVEGGAVKDASARKRSRGETEGNAVVGASWGPVRKDAEFPPLVQAAARWSAYNSGGDLKVYAGKVYDLTGSGTLTEVAVTNANGTFAPTAGQVLRLKCDDVNLGGLTLEVGAASDAYLETDGAGVMTKLRYPLGKFTSTDPGGPDVQTVTTAGNTTLYYRRQVPDSDLKANTVVLAVGTDPAAWCVELGPM